MNSTSTIPDWMQHRPFAVGMLHLAPLPGSPCGTRSIVETEAQMLDELSILTAAGFDAVMIENFGDTPFYPGRVPEITIAAMARLARSARQHWSGPLGINVLRNDGLSALAIALACEADFIRVNVLTAARLTDQGIVSGIAHDLLRARASWQAEHIGIWADVNVKHSAALATRPLREETEDLVERGGADVVIVTGAATGTATPLAELADVQAAAGSTPVVVGSGITAESIAGYARQCAGVIVGTALKPGGQVRHPIDASRAREFIRVLRDLRGD